MNKEEWLKFTIKWRARMDKEELHPADLACFGQVADVIGYDAAVVELQKVMDSWVVAADVSLFLAFNWVYTPQGHRFWRSIHCGYIPEGYTAPVAATLDEAPAFTDLSKEQQEHFLIMIEYVCEPPKDATHVNWEYDCFDSDLWLKFEYGRELFYSPDGWLDARDEDSESVRCYPIPQKPWYNPADVAFADKNSNKNTAHELLESASGHLKDRASDRDTGEERSMKSAVDAFNSLYADIIKENSGNISEEQGWMFMVLLKASRAKGGKYRQDDYEDGAAYFALAGEAASVERK